MRSVFTTFASSRFVDREAVVVALQALAQRLKAQCPEVVAVYLFGSFATGTATPRSDADVLIKVADPELLVRERLREVAQDVFLASPVPVDVFVLSSEQMQQDRGVAGAAAREGVQLA